MNLPSVLQSAPAAGASSASCSSKPSSSPARALSSAWPRLTGLRGFPCCFLRIPFQPNPSSASMLPSSRSPSRSRCSAASSSVLPPPCVSRATILPARSPAARRAWSLCPQSIAGAFSSLRKSRSRFFSWPLRAPPSAAFSGSRRCRLATIPQMSCSLGIMLHVHDPGEWGRAFGRAKRAPHTSSRSGPDIASVPGVSIGCCRHQCHAAPTPVLLRTPSTSTEIAIDEQSQARVMLVGPAIFRCAPHSLWFRGASGMRMKTLRGDFIAVVNRAFATRYLSSSNALGRQLRIPDLTTSGSLRGYLSAKHRLASDHRRRRRCPQRRRRSPRRPRHLPSVHRRDAALRAVPCPHRRAIRSPICTPSAPLSHPSLPISRSPTASPSTAPSPSAKPSSATHSTAASGSSPSCLASSPPWRSCSRWSASSASSLTASRSARRSLAFAWRSARRARTFCGSPCASRSSARPRAWSSALRVDSFLGAVLAHWMQNAFAAGSLFAAAALLALSALARLPVARPPRHRRPARRSSAL